MPAVAMSIVALVVVKCLLHVAAFSVGIAAAVTWARRAGTAPAGDNVAAPTSTPAPSPVVEAARAKLCNLAESLAGDVHAHVEAVGAASKDLTPVCQATRQELEPFKSAAVKTVAANMKLQRRLEDAERKIRIHINELRTTRR